MIEVLIVEDSAVNREYLSYILENDPDIKVIGTVKDGVEAVEFVGRRKPDVITMDIYMPRMDGFEATRKIMETVPVPIVIASASWDPKNVEMAFRALEAGAVAAVEKPRGLGDREQIRQLVQTVKLMAEVRMVRRWARLSRDLTVAPAQSLLQVKSQRREVQLVAMGASTGGPMALKAILDRLPVDFPAPIAIVQHIAPGFAPGFVDWLNNTSPVPVHLAGQGEPLVPAHCYIAPDALQMKVERNNTILLSRDDPEDGFCPAVSALFRSAAETFGPNAIGVLLTGMGQDGAKELGLMKEKGATTIAQDQETSLVHGMPGHAVKLGAATRVLPLDKIADTLVDLVCRSKNGGRL